MSEQLIPRVPKHKKQPTAEQLRMQLALAADEIIRLRTMVDWCTVYSGESPPWPGAAVVPLAPPPKPPKPPSCRIEYSHGFGRLMFETEADFEEWKRQPWWRRFLGLRPPKPRMSDYEWRRWLDSKAPPQKQPEIKP